MPLNNPAGLAGSPAVRRASRWYLTAEAGAVAADDALVTVLNRYAAALGRADQAVATRGTPCRRR